MIKPSLNSIKANCPVCKNSDASILYRISSNDVVRHFQKHLKSKNKIDFQKNIENRWKQDECYFVKCSSCSFCYSIPFVSGDSEIYSSLYFDNSSYAGWKWEYQKTYNTINEILAEKENGKRLLEIGAGNGSFVKKIASDIIEPKNIVCTEYSDYCFQEISRNGIKVFQTDIFDPVFDIYKGSFDFICLFQVVEHLDNLDTLFERLKFLSKKGANIFISVPNALQREFYDSKNILEDIPPVHISRWNEKCFDIIARRHGMYVTNSQIQPQTYISKVIRFLIFKLNTLNKTNHRSNSVINKLTKLISILGLSVTSFPDLISLRKKVLGVSLWIQLQCLIDE
jgi:2-polyprenyl-3-methyl-5-hydroxy-6-metoxy-1,4-benzoquinol methylase